MPSPQHSSTLKRALALALPALALTLASPLSAQGRPGATTGPRQAPAPAMASTTPAIDARKEAPPSEASRKEFAAISKASFSATSARPANVPEPSSQRILVPPALPRVETKPNPRDLEERDILRVIQGIARRGFIPCTRIDASVDSLQDCSWFPAGWRSFSVIIPPGENVEVHLDHPLSTWMRLAVTTKWGQRVRRRTDASRTRVLCSNRTVEPQAVFILVDDPTWVSTKASPFTLTFKRSWNPALTPATPMPEVLGIWAAVTAEPKTDQDLPTTPTAPAAPKG